MSCDCRYRDAGCMEPGTHLCAECAKSLVLLPFGMNSTGRYCRAHAERHNAIVLQQFTEQGIDPKHAVLAVPVEVVQ